MSGNTSSASSNFALHADEKLAWLGCLSPSHGFFNVRGGTNGERTEKERDGDCCGEGIKESLTPDAGLTSGSLCEEEAVVL